MPAVARLAVAASLVTGLALSLAAGLVAAGCGSDVDLGGFPARDAAPDATDAPGE
ncbi:MAG TPA: hypothetical protein PLR99_25240 [Polyangiaceae bacterium]|jgi:hypothetical protein|nr:hypothetical protein [Polyangiaceae bacterium]